jgi:hypothetical protein
MSLLSRNSDSASIARLILLLYHQSFQTSPHPYPLFILLPFPFIVFLSSTLLFKHKYLYSVLLTLLPALSSYPYQILYTYLFTFKNLELLRATEWQLLRPSRPMISAVLLSTPRETRIISTSGSSEKRI